MKASSRGGLVYSTDGGRMCPACRQPATGCVCGKTPAEKSGDGVARVSRETKGRAGKGVTLVRGLPLSPEALDALGRRLRAACGAGGTVKDGVVEVQGDHREKVLQWLRSQGHPAKAAGG